MQIFLKHNQGDVEKQISALVTKNSPSELTSRYESNFKQFEAVELTHEMNKKILDFSLYLKQAIPMLDNLIMISEAIAAAKKKQSERYVTMMEFMLPEYEKNCIKEYLPDVNSSDDCLVFAINNEEVKNA